MHISIIYTDTDFKILTFGNTCFVRSRKTQVFLWVLCVWVCMCGREREGGRECSFGLQC